jgi:hypothetical protein
VAALAASPNPFDWRGVVETPESYVIQDVNLLGEFDPAAGHTFFKPDPAPALDAARRTRVFQEFLRFSQYPFWQLSPAEQADDGTRVEAMDLRFGDPQQPGFVATVILDARQQVIREWFQFGRPRPR